MLRKTQKNKNLLKTKRLPKPIYKLSGGPLFTFSLSPSLTPLLVPKVNSHIRVFTLQWTTARRRRNSASVTRTRSNIDRATTSPSGTTA